MSDVKAVKRKLSFVSGFSSTGATALAPAVSFKPATFNAMVGFRPILLAVYFSMTSLTQRYPVAYIKSQFRVFRPMFDVVSVQFIAMFAALLASVIIPFEYVIAPFLIFVTAGFLTCFDVALVAWVFFAALEMRSAAPFGSFGSALDCFKSMPLSNRIVPHGDNSTARLFRLRTRLVGALLTAKTLIGGARRNAKRFVAMFAGFDNRRIVTFTGTVASVSMIQRIGVYRKRLTATFAGSLYSRSFVSVSQFVATGTGTSSLSAVFKALGIGKVDLTTNGACTFNHGSVPYWPYIRHCAQTVRLAFRLAHDFQPSAQGIFYHV